MCEFVGKYINNLVEHMPLHLYNITCYNVYKPDHTLHKAVYVDYPGDNRRMLEAAIRSVPKTWISVVENRNTPCLMQCFILETISELCCPLNFSIGWLFKPHHKRMLVVRHIADMSATPLVDFNINASHKIKITPGAAPFDTFVQYNNTLPTKYTNVKLSY